MTKNDFLHLKKRLDHFKQICDDDCHPPIQIREIDIEEEIGNMDTYKDYERSRKIENNKLNTTYD